MTHGQQSQLETLLVVGINILKEPLLSGDLHDFVRIDTAREVVVDWVALPINAVVSLGVDL